MKAEQTKERILRAAVNVAAREGYLNMRRDMVAAEANCATGLVSRYFLNIQGLRRAVMRFAIDNGVTSIIAEGLAVNDRMARRAPPELRRAAALQLAE